MLVLAFDTATDVATSALLRDGEVLGEGASLPRTLLEDIDALLNASRVEPADVDALVVGMGPGSFTSTRIGLAVARGLGLALGVPAAGVSTLDALAAARADAFPVIDARRREVFVPGPRVLEPDELITELRLPGGRDDVGSAYRAIEQPASGYSIAGVAAVIGAHDGSQWRFCSVGVTGVGEHPYRASAVEAVVTSGASIEDAAAHACDGVEVASDIHADREYRAHVATVQVRRALEAAIARLG